MSDSSAPATFLTADQAVQQIQHNILSNAQPHLWLTRYVQMNQVTLDSLIESDTFGGLSEFDEENPAPAPLEQVKILQAFIKKENQCGPHDVQGITALLKGFIERAADQKRAVDNLLLIAQLRIEETWLTSLPAALEVYLYALNMIQILNKMERMLEAIPEETQDKTALKLWIGQQRMQISEKPFDFRNPANVINLPYFMSGADQLSKFVRKEIQAILSLYHDTRAKILKISEFSPRAFFHRDGAFDNMFVLKTVKFSLNLLKDGAFFAIQAGSVALLPYRLALTLCREAFNQVRKGIYFLGKKFLPERYQWAVYVAVLLSFDYLPPYYTAFFSPAMIWGLQFFPASWRWNFIGKLALGFSVSELAIGAALGIGKFCKSIWDRRGAAQPAGVPGPVPAEQLSAEPVAAPILVPAANDIGIALNPDQKKKLQILLMRETMSVDGNRDMPADKKAKKKAKISTEQVKLHDMTTAYTLSKHDKKLLAKQADLPAAFENLEVEISPFRVRASA